MKAKDGNEGSPAVLQLCGLSTAEPSRALVRPAGELVGCWVWGVVRVACWPARQPRGLPAGLSGWGPRGTGTEVGGVPREWQAAGGPGGNNLEGLFEVLCEDERLALLLPHRSRIRQWAGSPIRAPAVQPAGRAWVPGRDCRAAGRACRRCGSRSARPYQRPRQGQPQSAAEILQT